MTAELVSPEISDDITWEAMREQWLRLPDEEGR